MGGIIKVYDFVTCKELENKILKTKLEYDVIEPDKVKVELEKDINSINFDGSKQKIKATILF
ncbi:hypothetical protein [Lysinibacillus capsici]|uniref:hypothetical protein n=1 Tax=Lysinibacillus capsici TaxID=2115968 RepID=UPI0028AD604E|nr:hypothetical protein [Lysinibacillus capsici]